MKMKPTSIQEHVEKIMRNIDDVDEAREKAAEFRYDAIESELMFRGDGPLTPFVLMHRAIAMADKGCARSGYGTLLVVENDEITQVLTDVLRHFEVLSKGADDMLMSSNEY